MARAGSLGAAIATQAEQPVIAVIGNPNTGKSTLFNTLTGLRQKTANYPGVTVERHTGTIKLNGADINLVDLPGAYSLAAQSPDEMIAVDALLGHVEDLARPRAILALADATNLRRNLFLLTQLAELNLPMVVAVNMTDLAAAKGIEMIRSLQPRPHGRSCCRRCMRQRTTFGSVFGTPVRI
jgi:ferrous iron transport protein B